MTPEEYFKKHYVNKSNGLLKPAKWVMEFADSYHKKQCDIHSVVHSENLKIMCEVIDYNGSPLPLCEIEESVLLNFNKGDCLSYKSQPYTVYYKYYDFKLKEWGMYIKS